MVCEEVISRGEARERGLTRYYTGKPCKYGHLTYRLVSEPRCSRCLYIKNKKSHKSWRDRNKDKIAEYRATYLAKEGVKEGIRAKNKIWQENNRDKCRSYTRKYTEKNPAKRELATRKWREENPEMVRAHWSNRRAREMNAPGSYTSKDVFELLQLQRGKCAYYKVCKTDIRDEYHIDHIVALANGGSNYRSNLQLLCPHCNLTKLAKDPIVFSQELGFLL